MTDAEQRAEIGLTIHCDPAVAEEIRDRVRESYEGIVDDFADYIIDGGWQ